MNFSLILGAMLLGATRTAPSMHDVLEHAFRAHAYSEVTISPDGSALAWKEATRPGGVDEPQQATGLYIRIGHRTIRLTATIGNIYADEDEPAWSHDGRRIAFLSSSGSHQSIFIALRDGSGAREAVRLDGAAQSLQWSPDDRWIAMLYIDHPHRMAGALQAGARQIGLIGKLVDEQRLVIVNVATGATRDLTPSNAYAYEYTWAPDSKRVAYTYAYGSGDNNWWTAKLAVASLHGVVHDLASPRFQMSRPSWSPDGNSIALIGGLMSDFGSVGGDVYLVNATTGDVRDITPDARYSIASIRWIGSRRMIVLAHDLGSLMLFHLNPEDGQMSPIGFNGEAIPEFDVTPDGSRVAFVRTSFERPAEIWTGPPSAPQQVTFSNERQKRFWGKATSLRWSDGDVRPQGWLIEPEHVQSGQRYPLVMIVHGGPAAESLPSFGAGFTGLFITALTSHGYFVFEPNPRGSFGQGEAYTRANVKDFGYGDWRDDIAGLDTLQTSASVDSARVGLFGWSYGGYMGMWAETQRQRFKAIVAGAGVADWQSYYGQNDIDEWMLPYFGASVYDDPASYARSSPMSFIKMAHTPILILQGERDEEVPAAQAFEFYHAMQSLGVPSQLMVYADEGHGPAQPRHTIDALERTIGWLDRFLKPGG